MYNEQFSCPLKTTDLKEDCSIMTDIWILQPFQSAQDFLLLTGGERITNTEKGEEKQA